MACVLALLPASAPGSARAESSFDFDTGNAIVEVVIPASHDFTCR